MGRLTSLLCALGALVLLAEQVGATPPDIHQARLEPICSSATKIVYFLDFSTNQGTYYNDQSSFAWVVVDLTKGAWTIHPIVQITTSTINSEPPDSEPEMLDLTPGKGKRLPALLREIGATRCPPRHGFEPDTPKLDEIKYLTRKGKLVVRLKKVEQVVGPVSSGPNTVVLRNDDQGRSWPDTALRDCLAEQPEYGACRRSPTRELIVGRYGVLQFHSSSTSAEEGDDRDTVYVVPLQGLMRARARLLNVIGLRLHRQKRYAEAQRWFATAVQQDPRSDVAHYNLACAHARLGAIAAAVASLERIRQADGLRGKLAADPDFESLRDDPRFKQLIVRLAH